MNTPHDYNPYQTPQSGLDDGYEEEIPPLYNPNAAALWSILFTPFGAWIHAKNWEAIGEDELARQNYLFVVIVLVFIVGASIFEMLTNVSIPGAISIGLLIGWYMWLGKKQITLFKEELGTDYEKKSLVMPVLVGVFGGMVAVVLVMMGVYMVLSLLGLTHPDF